MFVCFFNYWTDPISIFLFGYISVFFKQEKIVSQGTINKKISIKNYYGNAMNQKKAKGCAMEMNKNYISLSS